MCDYSLMGLPNRLAAEGEDLILHEFPTGTRGFTPDTFNLDVLPNWRYALHIIFQALLGVPQAGKMAVCIPPGARLLLFDVPDELRKSQGIGPRAEVTFTQLSASAHEHRDAIRFDNGRELLLQRLEKGQRVRVLRLNLESREELPSPPAESFRLAERRIDFIAPRLIR